jgi:hypothetical protein
MILNGEKFLEPAYGSQRGIDPETLYTHIKNTAPFIFSEPRPQTPYLEVVRREKTKKLSHFEYFELCLSAHYSTVATYVPTDVDNQIRKNLWDQPLAQEITDAMAELVLKSLEWDFRPVTARYQNGQDQEYSCGHQGEWFSVAVGAYATQRTKNPNVAKLLLEAILAETKLQARLYHYWQKEKAGIPLLKICTIIAHNLGDLDRVIDQWELPSDDPLRLQAYKLGHEKKPSFGDLQTHLLAAGALNKAFMASENHRHYPLRKPKCLRRGWELLLPIGPFFDDWGRTIATSEKLTENEKKEVAEALIDGFLKLSSPKIPLYGYARALKGLQEGLPRLADALPSKSAKLLQKGLISEINRNCKEAFESGWAKRALAFQP